MTTYSAFFSSGLLAPYHIHHINGAPKTPTREMGSFKDFTGFHTPYGDSSPFRPSSPLSFPDDSDIEIDVRSDDDTDMLMDSEKRELTPTQHSVFAATASLNSELKPTPSPSSSTTAASLTGRAQPSLRKRRSSLTIATSPMNAIRSPSRTAGASLQLQWHLAMSPGNRSRSGSITAPSTAVDGQGTFSCLGFGNVANEGTSLMGRLRSGSVGSNINVGAISAVPGRIRRHVRRIASGPAPLPPPTAPLPPLPPFSPSAAVNQRTGMRTPLTFQNNCVSLPPSITLNGSTSKPCGMNRGRGFSVSSAVERIEEEMKEN